MNLLRHQQTASHQSAFSEETRTKVDLIPMSTNIEEPEDTITLWTFQGNTIENLASHSPDITKSKYSNDVTTHYLRLFVKVGSNNFLWCSIGSPDKVHHTYALRSGKLIWELNVPRASILYFVDDLRWHKIIGKPFAPEERRLFWKREAIRLDQDVVKFAEEQENNYIEKLGSIESCWENLLRDNDQCEGGATPLLPTPIPQKWISPCKLY